MFSIKRSLFLATATLLAGMFLCSCGNGNPKTLKVKVEGIGNKVDKVILKAQLNGKLQNILAEAPFSGDGFTLELPETVPAESLAAVNDEFGLNGLTISDETAKCCAGYLIGIKEISDAGIFVYQKGNTVIDIAAGNIETGSSALLYYVDKDVNITGTVDDSQMHCNCILKKGWNYVATTLQKDGIEITTTLPEGMKWEFQES